MDDSLNICLPCGLCCDGTLIGYVELDRDEIPVLKEFLDVQDENGHGFFLQPCIKFCEACTVYKKRSKRCASYKCGLLKSVEQKELDFDLALEIINELKQKKIAIEKKIAVLDFELQSKSFYYKMTELRILLQKKESESSINQSQLELLSDIIEFDSLVSEKMGM